MHSLRLIMNPPSLGLKNNWRFVGGQNYLSPVFDRNSYSVIASSVWKSGTICTVGNVLIWSGYGRGLGTLIISIPTVRNGRSIITYLTSRGMMAPIVQGEQQLAAYTAGCYQELFSSQFGLRLDHLLQSVEARITDDMNASLLTPFSVEEIKQALDNIGDLKALGPDGLPSFF